MWGSNWVWLLRAWCWSSGRLGGDPTQRSAFLWRCLDIISVTPPGWLAHLWPCSDHRAQQCAEDNELQEFQSSFIWRHLGLPTATPLVGWRRETLIKFMVLSGWEQLSVPGWVWTWAKSWPCHLIAVWPWRVTSTPHLSVFTYQPGTAIPLSWAWCEGYVCTYI